MLDGYKLKYLRVLHNKTQKQVAEFCDVSKRYITGIERGEFVPSEEIYNAFLNCCYGTGEPLVRKKGARGKSVTEGEE